MDLSLTATGLQVRADDYIAGTGAGARDALVSPLFADLRGLPPLLIQAGTHELLLDHAVRLAAKAAADDADVMLDVIPGAPHVSQAFAAVLDESAQALDRAADFIRTQLAAATAVPARLTGSARPRSRTAIVGSARAPVRSPDRARSTSRGPRAGGGAR